MKSHFLKNHNLDLRRKRIRTRIIGTPQRPRLSIKISHLNVSAQIIDDSKGKTLASASSVGKKLEGTMTEKAGIIGAEIAKKAKKSNIKKVVLDRNGRLYHGRIKALADAARAGGLEF
jgi:large subunit ribosomal protein L18